MVQAFDKRRILPLLICFFAFTFYTAIAFLAPSHLRSSYVHHKHLHQSFIEENGSIYGHQLDDDHLDRQRKVRFRSRVSYFGTSFSGWQLQPDRKTIQGEIEDALYRRYNRRIAVVGAGRTDAGVHARGQAIHFDLFQEEVSFPFIAPNATASERNNISADFCNELQHSMNRMLPLDIRLFRLQLAPYLMTKNAQNANDERLVAHQDGGNDLEELRLWHSIQSSSRKWYSYRFTLGPMLSPMERFTRSQFVHRPSFQPSSSSSGQPYALTTDDIARLKSILEVYVGTHDFKAFGGQIEQIEKRALRKINTIRTIHKVELVKESRGYDFASSSELKQIQLGFIGEEGNYRIDFLIDGALYKMVRNMVGAAMDVWLGNMERTQLIELLRIDQSGDDGKSRKDNPCKPAPPEGLTLECVYYDDSF